MKKVILLCFVFLIISIYTMAQTTIGGKVVDRKGNPIPGAKVAISGTNESVLTELDGTFSMTTQKIPRKVNVYYVGMQSKKQKVTPNMLVKLSKTKWWNESPDKASWFVSAESAFPDADFTNPAFGISFGRINMLEKRNFGLYGKIIYSNLPSTNGIYYTKDNTLGNRKTGFQAFSIGCIIRIKGSISINLGAGCAKRIVAWQAEDGTYKKLSSNDFGSISDSYYQGGLIDIGFLFKLKHLLIHAGTMEIKTDNEYNNRFFVGNFSIGYSF